jgi:hypothetical protein
MQAQNAWWTIIVGGIVGALLWAGPVRAQPFPGGLAACQASLNTCSTAKATLQASLNTCTTANATLQASLNTCTTANATLQASLDTCQTDLTACQGKPIVVFPGDGVGGPALSYLDNGDGTFTDNNTLLMWEKKEAGNFEGDECLTTPHSVHTTCTWAEATGPWIAAINAANLGGHNDWRVPNVRELQSIVDYSKINTASSLPGFSGAGHYWSSTTYAGNSSNAWFVDFVYGSMDNADKISFFKGVRAVRGGR